MSGKKGSKHGNSKEKFLEIITSIPKNENGCMLWTLGIDKDGYGYYSIKGKTYIAHRFLYGLIFPSDYQGLVVMHACDVRTCCNIDHLSIGTFSENTFDMIKKSRNVKGCLVGTSKLTEEQVKEIRSKYPAKSAIHLAKEYGVCRSTIHYLLNGTTYVNASIMNEKYQPVNKPIRIEI